MADRRSSEWMPCSESLRPGERLEGREMMRLASGNKDSLTIEFLSHQTQTAD
jgi:tryptophanase